MAQEAKPGGVITQLMTFACRRNVVAAGAQGAAGLRVSFFGPTSGYAATEYSQLDSNGRLPNNWAGFLTGIQVRNATLLSATAADNDKNVTAALEMLTNAQVGIYIQGALIGYHAMTSLGCGPEWIQSSPSTAGNSNYVQNGGYPLGFEPQEFLANSELRIDTVFHLAQASVAFTGSAFRLLVTAQFRLSNVFAKTR